VVGWLEAFSPGPKVSGTGEDDDRSLPVGLTP
jgi:hypothetical protein